MGQNPIHKWNVIRALIQLGRNGWPHSPSGRRLFHPNKRLWVTRPGLSPKDFSGIGQRLSQRNIEAFIKGVVLAEDAGDCYCWVGRGSTTATPRLIHPYAERFGLDLADVLVGWCKKQSKNKYVPFGSSTCTAVTYREYAAWTVEKTERVLLWEDENKQRHIKAVERKKQKHKEHLQQKVERDAKRVVMIGMLASLSPLERLQAIAKEDITLEAVPSDMVLECQTVINQLDHEEHMGLVIKIDRRRKGVWGQMWRNLQ